MSIEPADPATLSDAYLLKEFSFLCVAYGKHAPAEFPMADLSLRPPEHPRLSALAAEMLRRMAFASIVDPPRFPRL